MTAREKIIREIEGLRQASDLPVLTDITLVEEARRQLIGGIAISAFVALEEFVRERITELSRDGGRIVVAFNELSKEARRGVLERTTRNYRSLLDKPSTSEVDHLLAASGVAKTFASLSQSHLHLSPISLVWSGSNLQKVDVFDLFKVLGLGVSDWYPLNEIARRCECRRAAGERTGDLGLAFKQLQDARHAAAHNSNTSVTVTVVRSLPSRLLATVVALDLLLSHAVARLQRALKEPPNKIDTLVQLQFIQNRGNYWHSIREGRVKGSRHVTRDEAISSTISSDTSIVEVDANGELIWWRSLLG